MYITVFVVAEFFDSAYKNIIIRYRQFPVILNIKGPTCINIRNFVVIRNYFIDG